MYIKQEIKAKKLFFRTFLQKSFYFLLEIYAP